jgi:2-oxoglutarate dehydrogenase E2 component (dihydrolipoamide succinyltransferase)
MAEKGISPEDITGTGPGGRILKEDAVKSVPKGMEQKTPSRPEESVTGASDYVEKRSETRKKLSQLRKTVSRRLVAVKNETAMLTTFNEVNMAAIMNLRKKYKESFKEKYDVNLGFMSFFTKACCIALQEWPSVNAKIDGDEVIHYNYCDISIAVSAPKGLVVPVIRNAESMNFVQIEREVLNLATKARENKLSIEEMTGGTFTITNGGVFGSMLSTPIINAPQSAILGMHNIVERPVVETGEVVIRPVMYVALSYDHRIIDGRESVSFLVRVKELLEDPSRLLLEI